MLNVFWWSIAAFFVQPGILFILCPGRCSWDTAEGQPWSSWPPIHCWGKQQQGLCTQNLILHLCSPRRRKPTKGSQSPWCGAKSNMTRGSGGTRAFLMNRWHRWSTILHERSHHKFKTFSGLQTCQKLRRWWSEKTKLMMMEFKRTSGWFDSLPMISK